MVTRFEVVLMHDDTFFFQLRTADGEAQPARAAHGPSSLAASTIAEQTATVTPAVVKEILAGYYNGVAKPDTMNTAVMPMPTGTDDKGEPQDEDCYRIPIVGGLDYEENENCEATTGICYHACKSIEGIKGILRDGRVRGMPWVEGDANSGSGTHGFYARAWAAAWGEEEDAKTTSAKTATKRYLMHDGGESGADPDHVLLKKLTKEEQDRFNEHAVKLGSTNPSNNLFNIKKLLELDTPKALVSAINEPPGTAGKASYSKAGGLHNNTLLAEGAKVGKGNKPLYHLVSNHYLNYNLGYAP